MTLCHCIHIQHRHVNNRNKTYLQVHCLCLKSNNLGITDKSFQGMKALQKWKQNSQKLSLVNRAWRFTRWGSDIISLLSPSILFFFFFVPALLLCTSSLCFSLLYFHLISLLFAAQQSCSQFGQILQTPPISPAHAQGYYWRSFLQSELVKADNRHISCLCRTCFDELALRAEEVAVILKEECFSHYCQMKDFTFLLWYFGLALSCWCKQGLGVSS